MLLQTVANVTVLAQVGKASPPSPLRTAVRLLLGCLIAVLAAYIAIEQIGAWRRRRSSDD